MVYALAHSGTNILTVVLEWMQAFVGSTGNLPLGESDPHSSGFPICYVLVALNFLSLAPFLLLESPLLEEQSFAQSLPCVLSSVLRPCLRLACQI